MRTAFLFFDWITKEPFLVFFNLIWLMEVVFFFWGCSEAHNLKNSGVLSLFVLLPGFLLAFVQNDVDHLHYNQESLCICKITPFGLHLGIGMVMKMI
jgi:hypothetical protein